MRWNPQADRPPESGDRRTTGRFAWRPITLDDGWRVWLEWYDIRQEYRSAASGGRWHDLATTACIHDYF